MIFCRSVFISSVSFISSVVNCRHEYLRYCSCSRMFLPRITMGSFDCITIIWCVGINCKRRMVSPAESGNILNVVVILPTWNVLSPCLLFCCMMIGVLCTVTFVSLYIYVFGTSLIHYWPFISNRFFNCPRNIYWTRAKCFLL